jgi:hypothetical protein
VSKILIPSEARDQICSHMCNSFLCTSEIVLRPSEAMVQIFSRVHKKLLSTKNECNIVFFISSMKQVIIIFLLVFSKKNMKKLILLYFHQKKIKELNFVQLLIFCSLGSKNHFCSRCEQKK